MPSKNIIKVYVKDGYYHIYNRGVDKRSIFLDEQDCIMFLHYLKMYLQPIEELRKEVLLDRVKLRFLTLNLSENADLLCFTLMPNHFHLLLKQHTLDGITKLLKRLMTAYVMYFNQRYERVGPLFQNIYKACLVKTDSYLLHLSRYIHLNSTKIISDVNFSDFSSYPYYLGRKQASWIKPQEILSYFKTAQSKGLDDIFSYQSFVEDYVRDPKEILGDLVLEDTCV